MITVMQGLVGSVLTAPRQARGLCVWRETGGQELGEPPSIELRVLGKWGKWAVRSLWGPLPAINPLPP